MARENTHRDEIQEFLDRMARAMVTGDGRTIASMWDVPAFVLSDADVMAVKTLQEVEQFFGGAKEQYNTRGITDTTPEIVRLDWLTPRIAQVQVLWPYLDAQQPVHGSETSSYVLRRDDSGTLKLRVALMHGASDR